MKLIFLVLLLSAVMFGQGIREASPEIAADPIETIFLSRDNGEGKPGEETATFLPNDIPIYCVITLKDFDVVNVRMNLVAVKVSGVKPESKVVTASYTTKNGQNRIIFTGRPDGLWEPGNYRIDVFVGGAKVRSIPFTVIKASGQQDFAPRPGRPKRIRKN